MDIRITSTKCPALHSEVAAARPAIPAPITMTLSGIVQIRLDFEEDIAKLTNNGYWLRYVEL